jgi:tetratricopeptide (TPR) repeat protein
VVEVGHTIDYISGHKKKVFRLAAVAVALIALGAAFWVYRGQQAGERTAALGAALRVRDGQIGQLPNPGDPRLYFPTQQAKNEALRRGLVDVVTRFPGTNEASMAYFHLGVLSSDENKMEEAEENFRQARESGSGEYGAMARWALQEVYASTGRGAQAEQILRDFVAAPTALISKEQATIQLATLIASSRPEEARALVEPLAQSNRSAVARYAQSILGNLPPAPTPPAESPAAAKSNE